MNTHEHDEPQVLNLDCLCELGETSINKNGQNDHSKCKNCMAKEMSEKEEEIDQTRVLKNPKSDEFSGYV